VAFRDGFYYFISTGGSGLAISKTRSVPDLKTAERKVVWRPPPSGPYSCQIWAPELHFFGGKWYIYFAADAGTNETHRLWVLENSSADPLHGEWVMKGKISDPADKWAIDGTVVEHRGKLYMAWSGWAGDTNGTQNIYIARLKNPWTIEGRRVMISAPEYPWEKVGDLDDPLNPPHVDVNEAPTFLQRGDKVFLVYSASGCWTDHNALGMLTASAGSDLLNSASWKKSPVPVFRGSPEARAFGPGHNCFFKSPDGKEDWILYHANPGPNMGCGGRRSPRAQPFTWTDDGIPIFGSPVPLGMPIPRPSGEHAENGGRTIVPGSQLNSPLLP
jgi:GH43 family beta-xylosidase